MSHRLQVTGRRLQVSKIILLSTLYLLLTTLTGCEAFVRKFTRKPKGEPRREEPVIQPEVYPDAGIQKAALYKDYFLFWQTWADELAEHLHENANAKKQKECAYEALDNLQKMKSLLSERKAKILQPLVDEFAKIKEIVFLSRLSSPDFSSLKLKVERIKAEVRRNFIFSKIHKDLQ